MKILLTFFVLFFSSSVFADEYPYNGKEALEKKLNKKKAVIKKIAKKLLPQIKKAEIINPF